MKNSDRISKCPKGVFFSLLSRQMFLSQWGMESILLIDLNVAAYLQATAWVCHMPAWHECFFLVPPIHSVTLFYLGHENRQVCFVSQVNARLLWHVFLPKRECVACRSNTVPTCFLHPRWFSSLFMCCPLCIHGSGYISLKKKKLTVYAIVASCNTIRLMCLMLLVLQPLLSNRCYST